MRLEDVGVTAYAGQVNPIYSGAVLQAAARILAVEARHSAWIRCIVGTKPAPNAFAYARPESSVLQIVKQTGFIVG